MTQTLSDSSIPILVLVAVLMVGLVAVDRLVTARSNAPLTVQVRGDAPDAEPDPAARLTTTQARAALASNDAFQAGRRAYRDGQYSEAATWFEAALNRAPDNPMVLNYLGLTVRRLGRPDAAERYWKTLLATHGPYGAAHLNLGLLYAQQNHVEGAERHYQRALALNPNHARAHFNLGLLYLRTDQRALAASHLQRGAQLGSGSLQAKAHHHHGRALLALGRSEEARGAFHDAIAVQPSYVAPRLKLAAMLPSDSAGLVKKAHWYHEAVTLAPDHDAAQARYAATLSQLNADSVAHAPEGRGTVSGSVSGIAPSHGRPAGLLQAAAASDAPPPD